MNHKRRTISIIIITMILSFNVYGQWIKTAGPGNGDVHSLCVVENKIFAGTWLGGIYLSEDNGGTWTEMNKGLTNKGIMPLTTDTKNASTVHLFAGT